jgi:hypothetical protein
MQGPGVAETPAQVVCFEHARTISPAMPRRSVGWRRSCVGLRRIGGLTHIDTNFWARYQPGGAAAL